MGNLRLKIADSEKKKNPTKKSCPGCSVKEYFKHVPRDIIEELKSLFKIDFEMFGYSYDI